jgi:UDP-N-acetylmuramate--alanine ligase
MKSMSGPVHLVGIGGMHMSAIAQLLLADGVPVSGSDLVPSALTRRLGTLGATVFVGHAAEHVGAASLVVATAAAKKDNVELLEAERRGIPVLARHEMVAQLLAGRISVAVAGTHGKTTTSSLIAFVLRACGEDPSFLLGGEAPDLGGNAAAGGGRHVVVEADEYAGAFLAYHPDVAVITNLESDHLDYFGSEEVLIDAFRRFATNVSKGGTIVACADSPLLRSMLTAAQGDLAATVAWYSTERDAEWLAGDLALKVGGGSEFTVLRHNEAVARVQLSLPGRHNVANAIAAFAAGSALGLEPRRTAEALGQFSGVHRRFEFVGEARGITIIDDYAHHPSEVRATLLAARQRYPHRRLVIMFQPHTYSRTQYLLDGFRSCFEDADVVYLLQTFAARETADAGMDAHQLGRFLAPEPTGIADSIGQACQMLSASLKAGDVFITLGAGDVTDVGPALLEGLQQT